MFNTHKTVSKPAYVYGYEVYDKRECVNSLPDPDTCEIWANQNHNLQWEHQFKTARADLPKGCFVNQDKFGNPKYVYYNWPGSDKHNGAKYDKAYLVCASLLGGWD